MNQTMYRSLSSSALGLLLLAGPLSAQTATPAPSSDALELSPFSVSTSPDRGYTVSESMTGSRVKIQIADLPYTVNVVTSEFLEDFGLLEFTDNITHVGGFTGLDVGGNFLLRGFASSYQLRDGFFRLGRYGSSNIDRIEIIKGSNAAVYGRSAPGGMMNMISKQPTGKASQKLTYNVGDYDTERLTFESSGPLLESRFGKSNYLLTASTYTRGYNDDLSNIHNREYFLTLNNTFKDGSKLTFMAESFFQERASPLSPAPLIVDAKGTADQTDDRAVGYALNLGRVNAHGPVSHLDRGNTSFTGIYEKKLSDVFSTRVSGNIYAARRDDYNQNNSWGQITINSSTGAAPTSARGATPNWFRIIEDGGSFQGDLLAEYWTNDHKIKHRTLVTLDINDYYRYDPQYSYAASSHPDLVAWNAVRTVTLNPTTLTPVAPVQYFTNEHSPTNGYVVTRNMRRRSTVVGGLIRHQATLMDERLFLYTGGRFDSVLYRYNDFSTAATAFTPFKPDYVVGERIERRLNEFKPNAGALYKVRKDFSVFGNYSQSYFVAQSDNPEQILDPSFKAEVAAGWDYGFKGTLLDNKINYTVSGFYITRENVRVQDLDAAGNLVFIRGGDQLVRGYEADLTWNISKEFSFLGSYGNVNSLFTDFGAANPQAIGRKVQFVSPYNGSLSLKYTPASGVLKGFSANIGVTFVGATPTELPNTGDTVASVAGSTPGTFTRVVTRSTEAWKLEAPAYQVTSLGLRYTYKGARNLSHTFAVNVNNLLDEEFVLPGSGGGNRILAGDKRSVYFSYTLNYKGTSF